MPRVIGDWDGSRVALLRAAHQAGSAYHVRPSPPAGCRCGPPRRKALRRQQLIATKPAATPLVAGILADLVRSKPALIAENALLWPQVIVLRRAKRPRCAPADQALLVLPASRLHT